MRRLKRIVWTILALAFLAVDWLWNTLHPLIRWIIDLIPLEGVKRATIRFMDGLSPYPTLLVFLIPLVATEPVKLIALYFLAHKEWLLGILLYGAAEVFRFGLVAFLFTTCRDKLLSIPWFNKLYGWFVFAHEWAYAQIEPMRIYMRKALAEAGLLGGHAPVWRRLMALWRYTRRQRAT